MNNEQLAMPARNHPYRPTAVRSLFTAHSTLAEIYSFSAKERDMETGLRVTSLRSVSSSSLNQTRTSSVWYSLVRRFGSRYYSSDLSIWLSVDPMSGKYPHQSNYVYCSNNPIMVIDPNGEDEWELARDGTLTFKKVNKDNDIVYATTSEGEIINKVFPVNTINKNKGSYKFKQEFEDENGEKHMESCTTEYMGFSDLDVGYSFFEFAAENTSVKWAISSSDKEVRVGTTGKEIFVKMPIVSNEQESYHSHNEKHSGESFISKPDRNAAKELIPKGVSIGVYMSGEKQYYMFEKVTFPNGTFYDYFGSKKAARSKNY